MTTPIDRDINAFLAYLRAQVPSPSLSSYKNAQRYQKAWKRYGYDAMDAARALDWYRRAVGWSSSSRPKTIDLALSVAVQNDAAGKVREGATDQPCATCQHLNATETHRGRSCDRLIIWLAPPYTWTCPEHTDASAKD